MENVPFDSNVEGLSLFQDKLYVADTAVQSYRTQKLTPLFHV